MDALSVCIVKPVRKSVRFGVEVFAFVLPCIHAYIMCVCVCVCVCINTHTHAIFIHRSRCSDDIQTHTHTHTQEKMRQVQSVANAVELISAKQTQSREPSNSFRNPPPVSRGMISFPPKKNFRFFFRSIFRTLASAISVSRRFYGFPVIIVEFVTLAWYTWVGFSSRRMHSSAARERFQGNGCCRDCRI